MKVKLYVIYDMESPIIDGTSYTDPWCERYDIVGWSIYKELADDFIEPRRKGVFICKKYKISEREYTKFANRHSMHELREYNLVTKRDGSAEAVRVVMTPFDYQNIEEMSGYFGFEGFDGPSHRLFAKKYREALLKLQYPSLISIKSASIDITNGCPMIGDSDTPLVQFDELMAYIRIREGDFKDKLK